MIVHSRRPIPCPHCELEAQCRTLHTHGGVRYDVSCGFCGNCSSVHHHAHMAVRQFESMTPHVHKIGMGYFLNDEEGAAYVFRSVDTQNHRKCMEITNHGGYDEMLIKFAFCPDCGHDNSQTILNLKEHFKE